MLLASSCPMKPIIIILYSFSPRICSTHDNPKKERKEQVPSSMAAWKWRSYALGAPVVLSYTNRRSLRGLVLGVAEGLEALCLLASSWDKALSPLFTKARVICLRVLLPVRVSRLLVDIEDALERLTAGVLQPTEGHLGQWNQIYILGWNSHILGFWNNRNCSKLRKKIGRTDWQHDTKNTLPLLWNEDWTSLEC